MTHLALPTRFSQALLLGGLVVLLTATTWFIVRTMAGDRLLLVARGENDYDAATKLASTDAAVQFAPHLANAHYQRGQTYFAMAVGEETESRLQTAIAAYRTAARLSPEDYRIWLALAQSLDRADQTDEARQTFLHVLALAPNYYQPHWAWGNHLLRHNQTETAFAEFKRALAIRPTELPLLFDYAWDTFNGDVAKMSQMLAPPVAAQAEFASLLLARGKMSEGLAVWRELNQRAPAFARLHAQTFINALLAKQQYGQAYEVWRTAAQVKRPDEATLTGEARQNEANWYAVQPLDTGSGLSNGEFERDLRTGTVAPFLTWRLTPTKGLTISRNNQHRKSGEFSLQLNFDVTGNVGFAALEQLVPTKPSTNYRLSFAAKIEDLQTLSAPLVEVYDPADIKRLQAATKPFALGTSAWQDYTLEFTTAAATDALVVRVQRPACGEPPCPIRGRIWLDNFKLEQK